MKQILLVLLLGALLVVGCDCSKPPVDPPPPPPVDTQAPSVPGGLTGTSTNVQVNLSWNASTDNVGVKEYVVTKDGVDLPATQVTNLSIGGLTPSTPYSFAVKARDAAGNTSASSATFAITTQPNPATPPTVTTGSAVVNSNTSITFNGSITSDGGASILEHIAVVSWIMPITGVPGKDSLVVSGNGNFSYTKTDCIPGLTYSYKMGAKNSAGVAFGNTLTVTATGYHLGFQGHGGVIFWVSADANKALVAATSDINPAVGLRWWPQGGPYIAVGATNNDLGGGDVNTNTIATHPQCLPDAAARRCYDLVQGGFSDWYLGNKAETEQLYSQRSLPGLSGTFPSIPGEGLGRWTSLEGSSAILAWLHGWSGIGIGVSGTDSKGALLSVRPLRKIGNW